MHRYLKHLADYDLSCLLVVENVPDPLNKSQKFSNCVKISLEALSTVRKSHLTCLQDQWTQCVVALES